MFVIPDSFAKICCVRRASLAASSVGRARASSKPFRVQRLGPAKSSRQGLYGHSYHVVERLLSCQRRSARLGVKPQ